MRPGKLLIGCVAVAAVIAWIALLLGVGILPVTTVTIVVLTVLMVLAAADYILSRRAWREDALEMVRRLPSAFAIGAKRQIDISIEAAPERDWEIELFDGVDPQLMAAGLPVRLTLPARKQVNLSYAVIPTRRGDVTLSAADARIRSRWGLCELLEQMGRPQRRRVYPDFAQIARYVWLAGDRRLQEIGIKTYQQRGEGTDFKQLSEYRYGDPVRHIDWKATQRLGKAVIREFQDERDQCIMLLVDCGRRMRADDRESGVGTSHFDQVLNAVMLLSYVALHQGDAVGALTFGNPAGEERSFTPRKGAHALNALMAQLYAVQPTPTYSDYVSVANHLLRTQRKRALVIIITNFRDEDSSELGLALKLLRSRHLVLLASLRERIVGELIAQPLTAGDAALDVGSAHLYEQSRRDAFNRLAGPGALMVDAEPENLGVALVNRYHAVKRAGLI